MSSLVSFEAAARHTSFKSAAKELNVTPAAISHQVKALERDLHCTLFLRHHRGVQLTETGAYLLVALQRGFESMSDAVNQLRARPSGASVTISATTAVSSLWLTPRLAQFWKQHGDISVAQIVSDADGGQTECDLSVHYGDIGREKGTCRRLFHDQIVALGSPRFAAEHQITKVSELASLPLIHFDAVQTEWTDWQDWFRTLGYSGTLTSAHRVNNYIIALQAAQDDMGAVLGWEGLTADIVASGRLVHLLPHAVTSPMDFFVKLHPQASARAKLFFDWLTEKSESGHLTGAGISP